MVAVAAVIFILLSMFYYEYVPEGQFYESNAKYEDIETEKKEQENPAFEGAENDEKVEEAEFWNSSFLLKLHRRSARTAEFPRHFWHQ